MASLLSGWAASEQKSLVRFGQLESEAATIMAAREADLYLGFRVLVVALLFLQKFALPGTGGGLGLDTPLLLGVVAILFARGAAVLDPVRLITFSLFLTFAFGSLLVSGNSFSPLSFGVVAALYGSLCFNSTVSRSTVMKCFDFFQKCMLAVAIIVIIQQLVQYTVGNRFWPNLDQWVPSSFLYQGYMYIRPLEWDSPLLKPNAIFFLEPSAVSAALGVAFLIEMRWFRRPAMIALFAVGMFLVLAGSGPLLVLIASPLLLFRLSLRFLAWGLAAALFLLVPAGVLGLLDPFLSRINEFSDPNSSAYARLVLPFRTLLNLAADSGAVFSGHGAGSSLEGGNAVQWPMSKLTYEYGFVTALSYYVFFIAAMFGRPTSKMLAVALFVPHAILGGGFVSHFTVMILVLACTLLTIKEDAAAPQLAERELKEEPPPALDGQGAVASARLRPSSRATALAKKGENART